METEDIVAYRIKGCTYGRVFINELFEEHISIQLTCYPSSEEKDPIETPIFFIDDEGARKVGWYFLVQSFINPIRNKIKKWRMR